MRALLAIAAALFLTQAPALGAQQNPLAAPYAAKMGDVAASSLAEMLKLRTDFRAPAVVTYEPTSGTIDVEVFAPGTARATTDAARAALGDYWDFIQAAHIPFVERRFKAKLTSAHYRLIYYATDNQGQSRVVIQFVNGQFLIP